MTTATTTKAPPKPPIADHIFGQTPEHLLAFLTDFYASWDWRIGKRRLGDPNFRHEHPQFEIVSQLQPMHGKRDQRFAVYARWRGES